MLHKKQIGQSGEDLAAKYLENRGFVIVDRNYWKPWGEIDLVAKKGSELRFVEVKTVTRNSTPSNPPYPGEGDDYEPEDNVHPWKRQRLRRIIETYILAKDIGDDTDWQIDLMSVYLNPAGELLKVEWLEDVIL